MSILTWDKPQRARSVESWSSISADGAPPGVYTPNMSQEDRLKWKAKIVGITSGIPQVEIRKSTAFSVQVLIIVSEGGFRGKGGKTEPGSEPFNVQISCNGSARFTFDEIEELHAAVKEAREKLKEK